MSTEPKVRLPKQLRGQRTRDRILDAAENLLHGKSFGEITVADLVEEASASIGSFYHLFATKEALLAPLYARYDAEITAGSERVLDLARWEGRSLHYRATRVIRYTVKLYRQKQGLMQTLVLHARSHSDEVTLEQQTHRASLYDRVTELLLERDDEITHPDPESAIRLGLFFVGATCRDRILFSQAPHPRSVQLDDRGLARELSDAFLSYLQFPRSRKETPRV